MPGKGRGKKKPTPVPQPPPVTGWMDRSQWTYRVYNLDPNSRTIIDTPPTQEAFGLSFNFPIAPKMVNAMLRKGKPLAGILKVSLELSGSGELVRTPDPSNTCDSPAKARPFVEGVGWDDWYLPDGSEKPGARYLRWWANPTSVDLIDPIAAEIEVPIHPEYWSSVFGEFGNASPEALMKFNQVMAGPLSVGLAFGAGCYFGHGLSVVGGTAKFTLNDFKLI